VPEPDPLFQGVRALPAGATYLQDLQGNSRGKILVRSPPNRPGPRGRGGSGLDHEAVRDALGLALADSIKHHLVADVPVRLLVSSGLDARTITALTARGQGQLHSITLGFQKLRGSGHDETS